MDHVATAAAPVPLNLLERQRLLERFAHLAAHAAGMAVALVVAGSGTSEVCASFGLREDLDWSGLRSIRQRATDGSGPLIVGDLRRSGLAGQPLVAGPPFLRTIAQWPLSDASGKPAGTLTVADPVPHRKLGEREWQALEDIAGLLSAGIEQDRRHRALVTITTQVARVDRMLRQVSEAGSCADALSSLLGELCVHHGAATGRIWRLLLPQGMMQEVSRFVDGGLDENSYYQHPPTRAMRADNSMTAEAIQKNEPLIFRYAAIADKQRYLLLNPAIETGLACQVSFPLWVEEQRFGIVLAFTTERTDLDTVVADIASLANTIRPSLLRKINEERIRFMAHHDDLTQLNNRGVFNERLAEAVAAARAAGTAAGSPAGTHGLALLYLDLDGFKLVNDSRGHEVGDKLLAAAAARLRATIRESDMVARIGGDEFAIIQAGTGLADGPATVPPDAATFLGEPETVTFLGQPEARTFRAQPQAASLSGQPEAAALIGQPEAAALIGQPEAATQLASRLLQVMARPFEIDGQPSMIGVSIGIALYSADAETPDVLQHQADTALYEAKRAGRNTFRLYEAQVGARQRERLLIERDLKEAIERQEFTLAYQPIREIQTLAVRGFEALLRWTHPTHGPLSPAGFVPLAEASGLILPLGRWALEAACAEAACWPQPVCLSVNFSPLQFRQPGLPQQIERVLAQTGLQPTRLDLEVTEGLLLDGSGLVLRTMHELRELGVRMTLDDFGTAYASLGYLRRFPFDRIKIDKSFIQGMCDDDATLAIVEAILSLSERLRLEVVAEGVETQAQLNQLRMRGCRLVQGYLTGRPVSQAALSPLLERVLPTNSDCDVDAVGGRFEDESRLWRAAGE